MSEALKRARKDAFVGREQAVAHLAQVKACVAEGYSDDDALAYAAGNLDEAQAVLDAAIAPEPKSEIQIPNDVKFLTAGVDVADGRFEVAVYGWTADGEPAEVERFVTILDDYPLSDKRAWGALEEFLRRPCRRDDGLYLHVQAACIDSGGAFMGEVYDFAKKHVGRRWWAVKARSNRKGERTAVWPEAPVKTSTGALLYVIDFDRAHEEMADRLSTGGVLTDSVVFAYVAAKGLAAVPGPFAGWSEPELRSAVDALEEKIAAEAKKPEPIRIPFVADVSGIEQAVAKAVLNRVDLDLDGSSIKISGDGLDVAKVVVFLLEQGKDLATGGIAGADVEPGLVGERAGEAIVSRATAEELRLKGAELMGKFVENSETSGRPIQIGDIVELKGKFKIVGMREGPSLFTPLDDGAPTDVIYAVRREVLTGYLVGDEIEVRTSDLRRL